MSRRLSGRVERKLSEWLATHSHSGQWMHCDTEEVLRKIIAELVGLKVDEDKALQLIGRAFTVGKDEGVFRID